MVVVAGVVVCGVAAGVSVLLLTQPGHGNHAARSAGASPCPPHATTCTYRLGSQVLPAGQDGYIQNHGSPAAAVSGALVPASVLRAIERHNPQVAYVPTRLPAGYHFEAFQDYPSKGFDLYFGTTQPTLGFHAQPEPCSAMGPAVKSFRVNGFRVYWSATYADQQAWRCLRHGRTRIVLSSSQSIPGDDTTSTPAKRNDALDLVRLVAYTRRLG